MMIELRLRYRKKYKPNFESHFLLFVTLSRKKISIKTVAFHKKLHVKYFSSFGILIGLLLKVCLNETFYLRGELNTLMNLESSK